ncbi:uncharacterized protein FOMMEDRAFT_167074 [Fomitiporia mediterranea MF3/22]|uniref:uncharacterized protein n=1 Tax=Fomitiporia mediterranea (strain MF3/22) TaxID=694068 RepID=UPI0004408D57|nr:uncharacterized protein FOMMEDRAFT_167074 [Fomitiporia mediterranea MF3/22]EJD03748.1 hypothetical protein FOMMEDRAFT_167074 [Fomitiporia mediterranea MF3/22]
MNQEQLFSLLQSFASLVPTKDIGWPTSASADEIQEFLIQRFISSAHFQSYTPAENYQKSFWKWVITNLEEQDEEVNEEIYLHYLSLLDRESTSVSASIQPPSPSYITYIWRDDSQGTDRHPSGSVLDSCRSCTLFESRTTVESGTTGLRTWTASFVLADYLVSNWSVLKSSRIFELGSGAGFLGIIIAQLQKEDLKQPDHGVQAYLCLSDLNENVLARCEQNVRLPCNGVSSHPGLHFKALDWSDALDKSRRTDLSALLVEVNADLILGADVVYDVTIIPSLVATLHLALTWISLEGEPSSQRHFETKIHSARLRMKYEKRSFV